MHLLFCSADYNSHAKNLCEAVLSHSNTLSWMQTLTMLTCCSICPQSYDNINKQKVQLRLMLYDMHSFVWAYCFMWYYIASCYIAFTCKCLIGDKIISTHMSTYCLIQNFPLHLKLFVNKVRCSCLQIVNQQIFPSVI